MWQMGLPTRPQSQLRLPRPDRCSLGSRSCSSSWCGASVLSVPRGGVPAPACLTPALVRECVHRSCPAGRCTVAGGHQRVGILPDTGGAASRRAGHGVLRGPRHAARELPQQNDRSPPGAESQEVYLCVCAGGPGRWCLRASPPRAGGGERVAPATGPRLPDPFLSAAAR